MPQAHKRPHLSLFGRRGHINLFAELGSDLSGIEKLRAMKDGNRLIGMEQTLGMRIHRATTKESGPLRAEPKVNVDRPRTACRQG